MIRKKKNEFFFFVNKQLKLCSRQTRTQREDGSKRSIISQRGKSNAIETFSITKLWNTMMVRSQVIS